MKHILSQPKYTTDLFDAIWRVFGETFFHRTRLWTLDGEPLSWSFHISKYCWRASILNHLVYWLFLPVWTKVFQYALSNNNPSIWGKAFTTLWKILVHISSTLKLIFMDSLMLIRLYCEDNGLKNRLNPSQLGLGTSRVGSYVTQTRIMRLGWVLPLTILFEIGTWPSRLWLRHGRVGSRVWFFRLWLVWLVVHFSLRCFSSAKLVSWSAIKQPATSPSSSKAEYISLVTQLRKANLIDCEPNKPRSSIKEVIKCNQGETIDFAYLDPKINHPSSI